MVNVVIFPLSSSIVHCIVPMYTSVVRAPPMPFTRLFTFLSSPLKSPRYPDRLAEHLLSIPIRYESESNLTDTAPPVVDDAHTAVLTITAMQSSRKIRFLSLGGGGAW